MSGNKSLIGLSIYDFSRLHNIEEIETAPNLEFLGLGNQVWAGMTIDSLKPVANTQIKHFEWNGTNGTERLFQITTISV